MDEANFMNEGGVVVTNTRAVINGTMYAMANVTSVSMGAIPPSRGGAGVCRRRRDPALVRRL